MHFVRTYTHIHARGNMCEHTCMWILFYILHNLHYRYGRTYTHIYVFSVASLIVVVASPVDVVIAAPAAAVLEVA